MAATMQGIQNGPGTLPVSPKKADSSIGREMYVAQQYLQTGNLFAWTVVVIILSTVFEKIFTKILELFNKSGGNLL